MSSEINDNAKEGNTKKGLIKVLNGKQKGKIIEVLYYPNEYSVDKSNTFSEIAIPGLEAPYLQYVRGNAGSISLELFYDTYELGTDVREHTDKLTHLLNIDTELHAPPVLLFVWGKPSKEPFQCVLEKVNKKFTMFLSSGIPVRARLSITLKEFKNQFNSSEKSKESVDRTKIYTVKQGDSLWAIAAKEYGDPKLWRPIAEKNDIENPRLIRPGIELVIPPIEE